MQQFIQHQSMNQHVWMKELSDKEVSQKPGGDESNITTSKVKRA